MITKILSVKNYGLPERIWLGFWSIMTLVWFFSFGKVENYWESSFFNVSLIISLIILPIVVRKWGETPLDLSRAFFSFISSYFSYERISDLINAYHSNTQYERIILGIDKTLFGGNPSEWFQAIQTPALSEYLQIMYWFYFPEILLIGFCLVFLKKRRVFLQYIITMNLALMFTQIFYLIIPLRSPFLIADLGLFTDLLHYNKPLEGLWLFDTLRTSLLESTSMRHDCFPSGHTMHSTIAMIFAWKASRKIGFVETIVAISIIISTLYLRYHYAIDLIVGAACAIMWVVIGTKLMNYATSLEPKDFPLRDP